MFNRSISELGLRQSHRRKTFRPGLTSLEQRLAPATSINVSGSSLYIGGDAGAQNITVNQTGAGQYQVQAYDLVGGAKTFSGVSYISIDTKGGADTVTLNGNGGIALLYGVRVTGGGGLMVINNRFNVNVQHGVFGVANSSWYNTSVFVQANTILGSEFKVSTTNGNDGVVVSSGCYVKGPTVLNLGAGQNSTNIQNSTFDGSVTVVGSAGNDSVTIANATFGYLNPGSMNLNIGAGHNTIDIKALTVNGDSTITCSQGMAHITILGSKFNGYLKSSSRSVDAYFGNTQVAGQFGVGSQDGADRVEVQGCQVAKNANTIAEFNLGGSNNRTIVQNSNIGGRLSVIGGAGSDTVTINNTAAGTTHNGGLHLNLGAGDNTIDAKGFTANGSSSITCTNGFAYVTIANSKFNGFLFESSRRVDAVITNTPVLGHLKFTTREGNDRIQVTSCQLGNDFTAVTDFGDDRVVVENCSIAGNGFVAAKGPATFTTKNMTMEGGQVVDYRAALANSPGYIRIEAGHIKGQLAIITGEGNDSISIMNVTVGVMTKGCITSIGSTGGQDTVNLSGSIFNSSAITFDGGNGNDTLNKSGAQFRRVQPLIISFP